MPSQSPARRAVGLSLFSHIGRHAGGLASLVAMASPSLCRRVMLLGCGPVEPFLVASLIDREWGTLGPGILCVDSSPLVVALLSALECGEAVPLAELGRTCRDDLRRRGPDNSNFSDRLNACMRDTGALGVAPFTVKDSSELVASAGSCRLDICESGALDQVRLACTGSFGLVYMGLLLANMRKAAESASEVRALLSEVRRCARDGAVIGVGASLSPKHGIDLDVDDVLAAGFAMGYVSLESLTLSGGQLSGDYGIAASPGEWLREYARPPEAGPAGRCVSLIRQRMNLSRLAECLAPSYGRLVLGATNRGGHWEVLSADETEVAELLEPDVRLTFNSVVAHGGSAVGPASA